MSLPWEKLKDVNYVSRNARADTYLRGEGQFAWVTQTKILDLIREQEDFANQVRNKLGICKVEFDSTSSSHSLRDCLADDDVFVEIKYSKEVMRDIAVKSPTFLEGIYNPKIYRSYAGEDGWGRAVNIEDEKYGVGFPEAVHSTLRFGEGHTIHRVGNVTKLEQNFDLDSFLSSFPHQWGPGSREALLRYFTRHE